MKWNKYTIKTTTIAEDFLSAMLGDLGIEGIEIQDNVPLTKQDQAEMFIDFLPELPKDEGIGFVSFYLEAGQDHSEKKLEFQYHGTSKMYERSGFVEIADLKFVKVMQKDLSHE